MYSVHTMPSMGKLFCPHRQHTHTLSLSRNAFPTLPTAVRVFPDLPGAAGCGVGGALSSSGTQDGPTVSQGHSDGLHSIG